MRGEQRPFPFPFISFLFIAFVLFHSFLRCLLIFTCSFPISLSLLSLISVVILSSFPSLCQLIFCFRPLCLAVNNFNTIFTLNFPSPFHSSSHESLPLPLPNGAIGLTTDVTYLHSRGAWFDSRPKHRVQEIKSLMCLLDLKQKDQWRCKIKQIFQVYLPSCKKSSPHGQAVIVTLKSIDQF